MTGFLIAGSASGTGKTTVALALTAAFTRRGLRVQPFKGGPDFLDTGHLTRIAGRPARNLDTWMLPLEANRAVLEQAAHDADVVLVEGMMGLFDGKSGDSDLGSSAEIARLLHLPVVLVLDAAKSARSLAAVLLGFELFDPHLPLAGVILNRVASERHYALLAAAIAQRCRTPLLGWLPREPALAIPERHLGLRTAEESRPDPAQERAALAELAERHLNLDALRALPCGLDLNPTPSPKSTIEVRIGVARDAAFTFLYADNLDVLRQAGAEIVPFSPLTDPALPSRLDALYLPGGYPELHAEALAANHAMHRSLHAFAATGRPIYAECGGMLYLAQSLRTADGRTHPMAGLLPLSFQMTPKLVQFGYVSLRLTRACLLGPAGTELRGHSFHYSALTQPATLPTAYDVTYSLSGRQELEGFTHGSILASYLHLHFRTAPHIARDFIAAARAAAPAAASPAAPSPAPSLAEVPA